ncbi:uncharacterized protein LOC141629878 [Silene latifolia]|uniref:uncharacterized protein LOC141629878 n=1 Tax=Silene latifolia TaxID=37657 RepID=UPI003D77998A
MCDGWSLSTNTSCHPRGRVWVLWNPTVFQVQFMQYTALLIHMEIVEISTKFHFYYTMVYAFNDTGESKDLWNTLNVLLVDLSTPGTINKTLKPESTLDATSHMKGRRSFKYYNMRSQVPEFIPCIQSHWNIYWSGTKMFRVVMKLKSLKKPLKDLNKQLFVDIENSAAHAWKALDAIQNQLKLAPTYASLISKEKEVAGVYRDLQSACYIFFVQKTKATWVNQGDNNIRYFHSILKVRSAKNKVFLIEDHQGIAHTDANQIQAAFLHYYEELLGTAADTTPVSHSLVQLGPMCTPYHCEVLLSPVTKAEIKEAIFSIPNHKASGPDGFSSAFFKDF